ncbi:MAG: hypothetical protein KBG54_07055 [Oscillospiraceae bacterium]|nr:hypothetical protein [Oscillospiraceae bacterium]
MLNTNEMAKACGFTTANEAEAREVNGVFCGDLLSWAMGRAGEGNAWCTVMGSVNSVAVSSLADCACIVLCHDAVLSEDALAKAREQGITVYLTALPEFEASVAIGKAIGII